MANKRFYLIMALLAVIFAVIGGAILLVTQKKTDGYVKTNAVVVDYVEKREYDRDDLEYKYMYSEIVEYTVDGVKYTAQNSAYTNVPKPIGRRIEIVYDPQNPSKCVFIKNNNLFAIVFFVFSGVVILAGIAKFVADVRKND